MIGKYEIEIYNKRVHFKLEVKRNITIIQGHSGTGKTTLINLLGAYQRLGEGSGIVLKCERPCVLLSVLDWKHQLETSKGNIIFTDENVPFIKTKEFAQRVNCSDNYFVIIYRDSLPQLSYGIEEIYGIHVDRESQKYAVTRRVYNTLYNIYNVDVADPVKPDVVVTEDSNSGNDFFSAAFPCPCVSAGGKSLVVEKVEEIGSDDQLVLAIVDGAAFGADMEKFMHVMHAKGFKCALYAPESFEYLVLLSGILDVPGEWLEKTYLYADSGKWASWERFYTEKLVEITRGTIYQYVKSKLNPVYLTAGNLKKIKGTLPEVIESE